VIEPVEIAAAYEVVAEQIRRSIYFGKYKVDSKLPSERVLAQQLGVSRTTLREGIRVLEAQGFLESRRGVSRPVESRAGGELASLVKRTPKNKN